MTTRLPLRKRIVFAVITIVASAVLVVGVLFAADLYVHRKAERSAGLNIWGYRGPHVGKKQAGESRVVMLGGSTVFGYGVLWHQAIPALLQNELQAKLPLGETTTVSVVNLGMNNDGAYSYPSTLRDFEYLQPDVVVLYEGYNDVTGTNRSIIRHHSPVFRVFGYYPLLPVVIEEKRLALQYGDLGTAYRAKAGEKVVFTPSPTNRAAAAALHVVEGMSSTFAVGLDRWVGAEHVPKEFASSCPRIWGAFCESTAEAIRYSLARGRSVVVVTQPYFNDDHRRQQEVLRGLLRTRFGDQSRVHYVNLGDLIDLKDESLSFDGMHLHAVGNARVAHALVSVVAEAMAR